MKNSNDTIWDRTNDLPIVPQQFNHCATAVPRYDLEVKRCRTAIAIPVCTHFIYRNVAPEMVQHLCKQENSSSRFYWDKF